jgi:hypothetical protein
MSTHLIIPDSHAEPDVPNDRFEWLGKMIYDLKPDVVVDIGDSADMPSLCSYDKGRKGYDARRYTDDIDSYKDAMEKLWHPYKKNREKLPKRIKTRGNHENRILTAESYSGIMEGTFGITDLEEYRYNDIVSHYSYAVEQDGIYYNHICPTPLMGKPMGSVNLARAILKQEHTSYTVGHSHLRDFYEDRGLHGMVVGCYFDNDHSFAGPANRNYWRGVVVKRQVENGKYDHQWVSIAAVKAAYG